VGAGVGAPLALLALGLAGWAILERRRRKRSVGNGSYSNVNGNSQPLPPGMFERRAEKAELVSSRP
jgi:hypothetical protein